MADEAVKYVWEGSIPLQIHLHKSEVASHPAPPPALVLAPRIGYLPLLVSLVKPYFKDSLPPGEDSIWFDYKGLPLKWYIPTGVLFDLLCAQPERPWNLTIHFRGYPSNILIPCQGEDSVKWNFVNSLKEAAYIINGNCKNVMNMSQSDQQDLWTSVMNGDLDAYTRLSPKLKMVTIEDEFSRKASFSSLQSRQGGSEVDVAGQVKTARIPVRLYVRSINQDFENLEDIPEIDTWDDISYLNRPVEFLREEGNSFILKIRIVLIIFIGIRVFSNKLLHYQPKVSVERFLNEIDFLEWRVYPTVLGSLLRDSCLPLLAGKYFTLRNAIESLLPEFIGDRAETSGEEGEERTMDTSKESDGLVEKGEIKLVRIQGIEMKLEIPLSWVVNNLMNPEYYLHISVLVKAPQGWK